LSGWRKKKDIQYWEGLDWVGYWLAKWRKKYKQENPNFVGQICHCRRIPRGKTRPDVFWQLAASIKEILLDEQFFKRDKAELKEYIEWLFDKFTVEEKKWFKKPLQHGQCFTTKENKLHSRYQMKDMKLPGKWRHWGWDEDG